MEENIVTYEVSVGQGGKMFTLWRHDSFNGRYRFIQNLSTELETANQKAVEIANGRPLHTLSDIDLKAIIRGDDVIRFGKYKDTRISEIPDDRYLSWLAKGGWVKNDYNQWDSLMSTHPILKEHAIAEALSRGLGKMYEDKFYTNDQYEEKKAQAEAKKAKAEARKKLEAKMGHYGEVGQRVEFAARVVNAKFITGNMYDFYVITLESVGGDVFTHLGGSDTAGTLYTDYKHDDNPFVYHIKATIKSHDEYKGIDQTKLARLSILHKMSVDEWNKKEETVNVPA